MFTAMEIVFSAVKNMYFGVRSFSEVQGPMHKWLRPGSEN